MGRALTSKREDILIVIFLGVVVAMFAALVVPEIGTKQRIRKAEAKFFATETVAALNQHRIEYGFLPAANNAEILAILRGQNPREIVFLEIRSNRINANGELTDPWGTPYRFDLSKPDAPRVWSCGPNRKDEGGAEGSDDIVSWR